MEYFWNFKYMKNSNSIAISDLFFNGRKTYSFCGKTAVSHTTTVGFVKCFGCPTHEKPSLSFLFKFIFLASIENESTYSLPLHVSRGYFVDLITL